jgi:PKD repeat protein
MKISWLAALGLALAMPIAAQSQLCTFPPPWASNNGGTAGGIVFFDLNVTAGFLLQGIDCNLSGTAGSAVTLELYRTNGTHVGNETNAGVWTLVGTDAGGTLSAARNSPTSFTMSAPVVFTPGSYGIGVRVIGSGQAYTGTGTGGTPTVVSDPFMTLTAGSAISALFTGTFFSIRAFNGCLNYLPASGLYSNFTATPTVGASPLIVQFTDTTFTSDPNGVLTWAWDFDNDGNTDSTLQNPQHVYAAPGIYSVKLTTTDASNPSSSVTKTDFISVDPVSADFTATPTLGVAPLIVNFTDASTGLVTNWAWDFDNDGNTDSTLQNPTWVYSTAGQYSVKLTASNSGQGDSVTKLNFIFATGQPVDPGPADILQYSFNEPRGAAVANSAVGSPAPAFGTAKAGTTGAPANPNWQGDPGRSAWQGNEPNFGCLGADNVTPYENRVDTGWPFVLSGSHTITYWSRPTGAAPSFPYAFGAATASARAYYAGTYMSLRSWGNIPGFVDSASDPKALPGWSHWALVVDDAAGTAQWYVNGVPDGAQASFTPNTFAVNLGNFLVGGYTTSTALYTRYFEMDDFRLYGRALTPAEILGCAVQEQASATTFGAGCAGASGVPTIAGSGGQPTVGNAAFQIDIGNVEAGQLTALLIGVLAVDGGARPLDISFLFGPGCVAETLPDLGAFVAGVGPSSSFPLTIPNDPALAGGHVYAQALVFATDGAASPALDVNIQN